MRIAVAYSFLSRFRIRPDREQAFIDLAREMESLVDREPGTLAFKFFRLEEPGMFAVYESFVDEAADKAHMETEHGKPVIRSEEHTSELQSLMRISYAVFCLKK